MDLDTTWYMTETWSDKLLVSRQWQQPNFGDFLGEKKINSCILTYIIYIYIYREREREREIDIDRDRIYIYIYIDR